MRRNPTTEIETTQSEDITSLLGEAFEKGVEVGQGLSGGSFGERVEVEAVENPQKWVWPKRSGKKNLERVSGEWGILHDSGFGGDHTYHAGVINSDNTFTSKSDTLYKRAEAVAYIHSHARNGRKHNSIFLTPAVMQQLGRSGVGRMLTKANPSNLRSFTMAEVAAMHPLKTHFTTVNAAREFMVRYPDSTEIVKVVTNSTPHKFVSYAVVLASKRNPESTSAEVYAEFHGKPSEQLTEFVYEEHEHENLAQLGELISLTVVTTTGYEATIQAPPLDGPVTEVVQLCSTEDKTQLYLVGGDQCIDIESLGFKGAAIKDLMVIGTLEQIEYCTEKSFHKFKPVDYYHQLGEETGVTPVLLYDPISKLMKIAGGEYEIKDVGIVN